MFCSSYLKLRRQLQETVYLDNHKAYRVNTIYKNPLEELYEAFNLDKPEDYLSYSLSISDVIALKINDQIFCHYVDI